MPKLTAKGRKVRAQIAADTRWSKTPYADRPAATAKARAARFGKYLDRVDPDRVLPEAERFALAKQAERADLRRMRLAQLRKGAA